MRFKRIAIVGVGLLGGSFAATLRRKAPAVSIVGVDSESVIRKALELDLVHEGYSREDVGKATATADLILLAAPIHQIIALLPAISGQLKPGALVTDVGSTKTEILAAANRAMPKTAYFLGGHPMAGAERSGVEQVDPLLFENAVYVLCNEERVPAALVDDFVELVETLGAKAVFLAADRHDSIAAVVSHLPYLMAVTLMNYAAGLNEQDSSYLRLAAGGFRSMTRVASSPFDIWENILLSNQANVVKAMDEFINGLTAVRNKLGTNDLRNNCDSAAKKRLSIPRDTRGFLRPHHDLYVIVEDKAGEIATIANTLARENINIKDIEVVKVRENEAGTIRLAFVKAEERERSLELLAAVGFESRIKD